MYKDSIDLRDFYNSALGHTAQRIVRRYIRSAWPDTRGMSLAGIGYPIPYLRPFLEEAERVIALMPAQRDSPRRKRNIVSRAGRRLPILGPTGGACT